MKSIRDIEKVVKEKLHVTASPTLHDRVLAHVRHADEHFREATRALDEPVTRRTIMRSPTAKVAAAAVIVVAVVLFIGLWDRSVPSAYAIEQTIEANQSVRTLHIKNFTTGQEEPREGWLQFDENGQVAKARAHMPEWASPADGPRVIVWKDGTVQMWLKRQNLLGITKADGIQEQLTGTLQELDPRLALAHISELEQQGKVEIAIEEPSDRTRPILMTATYLPESGNPGRRKILSIDPTTKLINVMELYRLEDGEYRCEGRIELHEYNQPIDAKIFDLANEVPANATRLDFGATDIGLVQGQLSDEEAATKVVRQFFESLIAGDYDAAGRLLPLGASRLKQQFGPVKFLRIVSVGPATRSPGSETKELTVPCTIEIEEDGRRNSVTLNGVQVQTLAAQPTRWAIRTLGD